LLSHSGNRHHLEGGEDPLKRPKLFYGWVQVWVTLAAGAFSAGAGFWAFTVFVTPMGDDLGWSRAELYGAMTVRALVSGALSPFMGPFQDSRAGPRIFAVATTLTMATSMIAMKWIDDLLLYYVIFGAFGALANFGSTEMMMSVVIPRWFVRQRGRALGIASMGTALGPLLFPFIVTFLLSVLDWRDAWLALGLLTLAVLGPISLLVRTRPEDMGLLPDGDTEPAARPDHDMRARVLVQRSERDVTRTEAIRMQCFWLLILAACFTTLGTGGFHANWLPYFRDLGFTSAQGSLAATTYGVCSLSSRVVWGWLSERFELRYVMGLQGFLTFFSVVLFLNINSPAILILAAACNGLALGGIFVMRPMIVANYFGRGHLGSINGIMRPFVTLANAASPLLVALLYDRQGSYEGVFWIIAIGWLVAAAAVLLARSPQPANSARAELAERRIGP
jgi:MFS family permease